jgi:hypothetical protein
MKNTSQHCPCPTHPRIRKALRYGKIPFLALAVIIFTGCCGISFAPYDYDKGEDAKLKRGTYSLRFKNKEFHIEKKFKLSKPH